jgi:hypothetical protein
MKKEILLNFKANELYGLKNSKAPDGQGPLLTNYKPKL